MWATIAFLSGVACAGIVLVVCRAREPGPVDPAARSALLGWLTLAFGVMAIIAFVSGILREAGGGGYLASIACASAAVIIGVGGVLRRDRRWPTWVGLAAGMVPAVFWIVFAVGNILGLGS